MGGRPPTPPTTSCCRFWFAVLLGRQVGPMETVSVVYRLVPKVPGHVLLPTVAAVPVREKVGAAETERDAEFVCTCTLNVTCKYI